MPDVLIRDVPRKVLDNLKRQAKLHRRSLQQELRQVLRDKSEFEAQLLDFAERSRGIRERLLRRGGVFADSAESIRQDRER
jgi:plasmid stability protein